jgi:hypothetical protein
MCFVVFHVGRVRPLRRRPRACAGVSLKEAPADCQPCALPRVRMVWSRGAADALARGAPWGAGAAPAVRAGGALAPFLLAPPPLAFSFALLLVATTGSSSPLSLAASPLSTTPMASVRRLRRVRAVGGMG